MKINYITLDNLIHLGSCKDGIDFATRNNVLPVSVDYLNSVKGDYNEFISWLKESIDSVDVENMDGFTICKRDDRTKIFNDNNILIEVRIDSDIIQKYNHMGHIIEDNIRNETYDYIYDCNGNMLQSYINNDKCIEYVYDDNGNCLREYNHFTDECTLSSYDDENRLLIHKKTFGAVPYELMDDIPANDMYYSKTIEYDGNKTIVNTFTRGISIDYQLTETDNCGNIISFTYELSDMSGTCKHEQTHTVKYYDNNQLKQYDELHLPFIERIVL